jgi:hypothetical protein
MSLLLRNNGTVHKKTGKTTEEPGFLENLKLRAEAFPHLSAKCTDVLYMEEYLLKISLRSELW